VPVWQARFTSDVRDRTLVKRVGCASRLCPVKKISIALLLTASARVTASERISLPPPPAW